MKKRSPNMAWGASWAWGLLALMAALPSWVSRAEARQDSVGGVTDVAGAPGEVSIQCEWFGVGGWCRPGEYTGIRLAITDGADKQREVLVRITLTDADGDRPQYERVITTNPGVKQQVWLYPRLPFWYRGGEVLTVSAYAAVEEAAGAESASSFRFRAGRLLGLERIQSRPTQVTSAGEGMMGIIGRGTMGLLEYGPDWNGNAPYLPTGHEKTRVVTQLSPAILPDVWSGLIQYDVLVWTDPAPAALGTDKAQALREWVQRGGHLIVVLPPVGQTWTDEVNNPLFDITPRVRVVLRQDVNLDDFRPMITASSGVTLPDKALVQTFEPLPDGTPAEASQVLASKQREWVVVRRLVGTGAVTFVGLDLAARALDSRGLPDPELFWNRVLGRRGVLKSETEIAADMSPSASGGFYYANRAAVTLDKDIPDRIAKSGTAAFGVLLGIFVFIAYWVVAGPGSFFALKRFKLAQHAWVAFVAAAAVFTAVAWSGATVLRPDKVESSHMTLLDHVYGQSLQRTRTWMSLLIPEYGDAGVSVGDPAERAAAAGAVNRMHDLIAPWEGPRERPESGFPDGRGYPINVRDPASVVVPVRSTVKQFRADWAGGPRWGMPRPVSAAGEAGGTIRVRGEGEEGSLVSGTLVHQLPGPLTDVLVIVNRGQLPFRAAGPGNTLTAAATAYIRTDPWLAGDSWDLSTLTASEATPIFLENLVTGSGAADSSASASLERGKFPSRARALALYSQLEPPNYTSASERNDEKPLVLRESTHGWDLGRWFGQPCIIVVGLLGAEEGDSVCPTPIFVNTGGGWKEAASRGVTVVRWVYPLSTSPAAPPQPTVPEGEKH